MRSIVDNVVAFKGTRVSVLELMDDGWCKVRRQDDETDAADDLAGQEGYCPFQFLDNPMGLTVTSEGIKVGKDAKGMCMCGRACMCAHVCLCLRLCVRVYVWTCTGASACTGTAACTGAAVSLSLSLSAFMVRDTLL